jgi:CrcB protein
MTLDLRVVLVVGVGAALGGILRLLVTQFVAARFGVAYRPCAPIFINIGGCYLIGIVIETSQTSAGFDPLWRSFLATGVLGGYTPFSIFSYEALTVGASNVAVSFVLGIVGATSGVATAKVIGG